MISKPSDKINFNKELQVIRNSNKIDPESILSLRNRAVTWNYSSRIQKNKRELGKKNWHLKFKPKNSNNDITSTTIGTLK